MWYSTTPEVTTVYKHHCQRDHSKTILRSLGFKLAESPLCPSKSQLSWGGLGVQSGRLNCLGLIPRAEYLQILGSSGSPVTHRAPTCQQRRTALYQTWHSPCQRWHAVSTPAGCARLTSGKPLMRLMSGRPGDLKSQPPTAPYGVPDPMAR